jgi:starch synthase (maltosyl-transferring)
VIGRLGITSIRPVVSAGDYPARAVVGEHVPVSAVVFREGHDAVGASVALRAPDGRKFPFIRMLPGRPGLDEWQVAVIPDQPGLWSFAIEAWSDPLSTWHHAVTVKMAAGQQADEMTNDLETGARLFDQMARELPKAARPVAAHAAQQLRDDSLGLADRVAPALDRPLQHLMHRYPVRELLTRSERFGIYVDRPRALYGSWYEFFPRSIGAELAGDPDAPARPLRHGTLKDAAEHLDYVAAMGFDVVYLPPIHPIGRVNRKGPNNTLDPAAWDVGSPWAIGSSDGGHDAIHPDLGTKGDFKAFVKRAKALNLEVALDFALQAAPDHPWVAEHPEWFTTKPDGSIAYAENPPKKYQDIYPINFDNDQVGIYAECLRVLEYWITLGVRIFRVDNPHTKPLNFWNWLITEAKNKYPDVLFLAEAFTRPAMMHALAQVGFTQSYTYYTWRNGKDELQDYLGELVEASHYMRPNFFVNTPDILPEYLQTGGPAAFRIRAVLAATLSPTWGVYSGYELYENQPVRPGSEEYLDSEKYQLRPRDFATAMGEGRSLAGLLTTLNGIRRNHEALHWLRNLHFHQIDSDAITVYSKRTVEDTILVVCSTDPHNARSGWTNLDMAALGRDWGERFIAHDLLTGAEYEWGQFNFVDLRPDGIPAHVFAIRTLE